MASLAIASTPAAAPSASGADNAAPGNPGERRFDDTLRETRAGPKPPADGHPGDAGNQQTQPEDGNASTTGKDNNDTRDDPAALPGMAPAVPVTAAATAAVTLQPTRQTLAANGKPVPATAAALQAQGVLADESATAAPATLASAPGSTATTMAADPKAAASRLADAAKAGANDAGTAIADHAGQGAAAPSPGHDGFGSQLAQLAGIHTAQPAAQPAAQSAQLTMQASPGQPQFAHEAAQHVSWLVGQNVQQATIQLNPRALGPIHIEIATHHDRVDVSFAVQHPQTVHALQQTLPQLHDMLAQQGLNLGQASVGQQAPGQQHAPPAHHGGGNVAANDATGVETETRPVWRSTRIVSPGRVDDFA